MRVLFTVSDWPGHWSAMVPLGWALQAAGHEVRVVCAPSQEEPLARAGLTAVPVLDGWDMAFQGRLQNYLNAGKDLWPYPEPPLHPVTGEPLADLADFDLGGWFKENVPVLSERARRSTDAAVGFARWWRPDVQVHDLVSIEGLLLGRVLGIPSAVHLWGPAGTDEHEPGLTLVPVDMSRSFERYAVGEPGFDRLTHVIDPNPAALAPALLGAERLPVRFVPYNGPGAVPGWLAELPERPRVCVVWGTSVSEMFGEVSFTVPKVVEALSDLGVEVVLTLTGADRDRMEGELPDGVRLLERVPLHLLLPHCDLVVHHGGAGCVMTALAAGVPQLALTNGVEQRLNADRIAAAGAGLGLSNAAVEVAQIRAAAERLLRDPAHRAAAERLRAENEARPAPADLVRTLEQLAARQPAAVGGAHR
ncbi:nucleotide disphospho-sugar-binding domain-containing protein [Kitasatospora sp. NPDC088391]|uniref:nucleotide disphospho-sugar-binding domain-containing protein n=1 Tax=Kitasatospora sp. NPDC088391 TaxID=3364074 RepID=UPI0038004491